jgi:hypothetical protein
MRTHNALPGKGTSVEKVGDPKATLKQVLGKRVPEDTFQRLGATVPLDSLSRLTAYQSFSPTSAPR